MQPPIRWLRCTALLTTWLCATIAAAQNRNLSGWATGPQWNEAVKIAQDKNKPVVILLHSFRGADDSTPSSTVAREWASHGFFRDMVRIHVDRSDKPAGSKAVFDQVSDRTTSSPKLYITTPDLCVTGYVVYKNREQFDTALQVAGQLLGWVEDSKKKVARADQQAERGQYEKALEAISEIAEADRRATLAMMRLWSDLPADAPLPKNGIYFPQLDETKRAAYREAAAAHITQATQLYEDLKYAEAMDALRVLTVSKPVLPEQEQARELREQVEASQKQQQTEQKTAEAESE